MPTHKIVVETSQPDARRLLSFQHSMFGTIEHVPIYSPELDERVRARYQSGINELTGLGFNYLCSDGEGFPLFRLLLMIPAIVIVGIWREGTPVWVRGGSIIAGYPILVFRTNSTFAHLDGPRVKFSTAFRDGTLLVSGNYADPLSRGPGIVRYFQAGCIIETWTKHKVRIQALETEFTGVDRRSSYEDYVEMSARDTAAW
jgi:hypothetical protein